MRDAQQFTENAAIHYERDDVTVDIVIRKDELYRVRGNLYGGSYTVTRRHIVAEVNGLTIPLGVHRGMSKQEVLDELATKWANSSLTKDESLALCDVDVMGPELVETRDDKEIF